MAITLCPATRLKAARSDRISAGRFFSACRSANGNGTRTTSNCSKLAIGLVIFGGMPLTQRSLNGLQVLNIDRINPPHRNATLVDVPCKQVAGLAIEGHSDLLWYG